MSVITRSKYFLLPIHYSISQIKRIKMDARLLHNAVSMQNTLRGIEAPVSLTTDSYGS